MGTDNLYRLKKKERQARISSEKKARGETWLFICEGTTEKLYFDGLCEYLNNNGIKVKFKAEDRGENTESLVKSVDKYFRWVDKLVGSVRIPYGKTFTVFDKDSFEKGQFNNAVTMSLNRKYVPLWTNESFELWYLLHYEHLACDIGREQCLIKLQGQMLKKHGVEYNKTDPAVFGLLMENDKLKTALRNSKKLHSECMCDKKTPSKAVPCTKMFELFEILKAEYGVDMF